MNKNAIATFTTPKRSKVKKPEAKLDNSFAKFCNLTSLPGWLYLQEKGSKGHLKDGSISDG
jgi:hypothetical protein